MASLLSQLVCLPPNQVGTLCCVPGQDTLFSGCLSPPRCINVYYKIARASPI